jgi:diaminopimelate decarboxylase
MPMSQSYKDRLFPILPQLAAHYGTPFHIYDEAGIRATGAGLNQAFAGIPGFREYYAVKALPNRRILEVLSDLQKPKVPELISFQPHLPSKSIRLRY